MWIRLCGSVTRQFESRLSYITWYEALVNAGLLLDQRRRRWVNEKREIGICFDSNSI